MSSRSSCAGSGKSRTDLPQCHSIRPLYILEKTLATFGTFSILVLIVDSFILPVTSRTDTPLFGFVLDLALPFTLAYLLIFYVIFEGVCNGFAELTRFADRNLCVRAFLPPDSVELS